MQWKIVRLRTLKDPTKTSVLLYRVGHGLLSDSNVEGTFALIPGAFGFRYGSIGNDLEVWSSLVILCELEVSERKLPDQRLEVLSRCVVILHRIQLAWYHGSLR